jgi:hypothetical protein
METDGALPCTQETATGPCPDPVECNSRHFILSVLILSYHFRLGIPNDL